MVGSDTVTWNDGLPPIRVCPLHPGSGDHFCLPVGARIFAELGSTRKVEAQFDPWPCEAFVKSAPVLGDGRAVTVAGWAS